MHRLAPSSEWGSFMKVMTGWASRCTGVANTPVDGERQREVRRAKGETQTPRGESCRQKSRGSNGSL